MEGTENKALHSWVTTAWTNIIHGRGKGNAAGEARGEMLVRYHETVYHYFLKKIGNQHAAEELYSNFALRLMETDDLIKRADPERGRFRNYLKTALHHMVMDYYRKRSRKKEQPLAIDVAVHDAVAQESGDADADFSPIWQQEMLNQAWKALENIEKKTGQMHYTVLRFQSDHADLKAPQIAEQLGAKLGKTFTPESIRQTIHRGREKFAKLLLEEVEHSLDKPSLDELEQELIDLQLLPYCKRALEQRRAEAAK